MSVPSTELRTALREAWTHFTQKGWHFARLAAEAEAEQAHTAWGYRSLGAWAQAELGFTNKSTFYRYVQVGKFLASVNGDKQRWLAQPVFNVIEVLPLTAKEPDRALAILEHQPNQAAIRAAIREADAERQHYDKGYRRITATVSEEVLHEWRRLVNRVRVSLGVDGVEYPTDAQVIEAIVAEALPAFRLSEADEIAVDSGDAKCHYPLGEKVECGSYAHLQRHHVLPRSHQGHEGPLVYLCAKHHEMVTRGENGVGWRELAAKLGYDEIAEAP